MHKNDVKIYSIYAANAEIGAFTQLRSAYGFLCDNIAALQRKEIKSYSQVSRYIDFYNEYHVNEFANPSYMIKRRIIQKKYKKIAPGQK